MLYGYARVSTQYQNEERQLIALKAFGVSEEKIYVEKQSGKDFNRRQYKNLVRRLKPDDVLVIKSIDRLGRNYRENKSIWSTKEPAQAGSSCSEVI